MKSTKKSLILSVVSMLLCVAMLAGTTFAWFTDSVTSGTNKIVAGNLDIELEYSKTGADDSWATVQGATDLFDDVTLWEPGATSVVYLKLTNKGTLALKYNLAITATGGDFTNAAGQSKNLKDALKFAQVAGPNLVTYVTRDLAVAATASVATGLSDYAQANHMAATDVSYITLVVTMPTTVGNEFNYKTGTTAPTIELSINLTATQYSAESDSFDKFYDVTATPSGETPIDVYSAEEFNNAVAQSATNTTINIAKADLDLTVEYTDAKTFTLRGEKIKSLTANIPNGTIHVYNEVVTVSGTNVDYKHSAHFYNKVTTLEATAGHFVVEAGATVENIVATPVLTTDGSEAQAAAKDLKIEVKGAAKKVTTPEEAPVKDVEIKVAGTVEKVEIPKAVTNIAVKVEETATVEELNITDTAEDAKIVLQNDGTVENEEAVAAKTQAIAEMDTTAKTLTINNADELKAFAKGANAGKYNGYTATLGADIDLENVEWTQIDGADKNLTFDGNGKTIKNLKISDGHNAGFFKTGSGCKIMNLTVDGATVTGVGRIAVICGHGMCVTVDNCTVKNATVTAVVTNNDDGDKAGAIVGYLSAEPNASVIGCAVENVTVKGYRDIGALVGYAAGTYTIKDNTLANVEVICDKSNNYKNYTTDAEFDVNLIVGEKTADGKIENTGIIAGTYAVDPTVALAEGFLASFKDNAWVVEGLKTDAELLAENPNYTCRIGNTGYERPFGDNTKKVNYVDKGCALYNAKSGDTIKMIADYNTTNAFYAVTKTNDFEVTIDLNGKTIEVPSKVQLNVGTYNITDTSTQGNGKISRLDMYNMQDRLNTITVNVYGGNFDTIATDGDHGDKTLNIYGGNIGLVEVQGSEKAGPEGTPQHRQAIDKVNIYGGSIEYISVNNGAADVETIFTLESGYSIGEEITGAAEEAIRSNAASYKTYSLVKD